MYMPVHSVPEYDTYYKEKMGASEIIKIRDTKTRANNKNDNEVYCNEKKFIQHKQR